MAVVLSILCGMYGTYCFTLRCTLGYTMYNEHIDEKKKKIIEVKKQYQQMIVDKHVELKHIQNSQLEYIQININNNSMKNIKLYPIKEIDDILEDSECEDEEYLLAEKKELI